MKFSEEALMIRDAVAEYATALQGTAHDRDLAGTLERDEMARLAELGLFGIALPEEAGGVGAGPVALVLAFEELAARCPSTALALASHALCATGAIHALGTDLQRSRLLEVLVSGEVLATLASGGDVRAEPAGDGWTLSGRVEVVPALAVADRIVVEAAAAGGKAYFLVESGGAGVSVDASKRPVGMRAAGIADLVLDGAGVASTDRLAGDDLEPVLATARLGSAALSVGIGRGALECARTFARERSQFGRTLSTFGAIRSYLAEMSVAVESARRLALAAATAVEEGTGAALAIAVAKFHAAEAAVRASDLAVQIHGGYGYVAEYPAERYYRDAQVPRSLLTTDDEERARIADLVLA